MPRKKLAVIQITQVLIARRQSQLKWRDVYASSLAKRPYDEDRPTTTRPPTIRLAERPDESWDDDPSDSDSDHDLEDSPLDHTASSHDTFSIGSHIDITSPFLLDILSDAPVQKPAGSSRVSSKRPTVPSTLSAPSAPLDDNEWY
ncbi:hypothetical protein FIBSPDRAFT_933032 [Athelia psychrophila]|uniref:Uncharacterized protein n=1 Tax=Athelia psychrophila TaxID=1759441 RepID=A0A166HRM4_9AGAM|nr:hypothetical protein FIBSPDRAFT_933032 [Fibularhizoctonia sp. CBS 109695]